MSEVANDNETEPSAWLKAKPWLTYPPVVAAVSIILTGAAQFWVQGLVRDAEVSGAKAAATLSMAGQCQPKAAPVQVDIEKTARLAATGASTICTKAIEDEGKRRAASARRPAPKPKETGSLF